MSLAPTYEAIRLVTSGKLLMREKPAEFWALDISVRMVVAIN
jgi:hypothetical protein